MPEDQPDCEIFRKLCDIMTRLRSSDGCPWDAAQTPESLKPYIIEEAYELIDAIDSKDPQHIKEELGDLLLQIVFQAEIHKEKHLFDLNDIMAGIADKLTRRHPHVFACSSRSQPDQHALNWDRIKTEERALRGQEQGLLAGIPRHLPALQKTQKILAKLKRHGQSRRLSALLDEVAPDAVGHLPGLEIERRLLRELVQAISMAENHGIDLEGLLRDFNRTLLSSRFE